MTTPDEARKLADLVFREWDTEEAIEVENALRSLADQVDRLENDLAATRILYEADSQDNSVNAALKDVEYYKAETEKLTEEIRDYRLITEGHCNKNLAEIERLEKELVEARAEIELADLAFKQEWIAKDKALAERDAAVEVAKELNEIAYAGSRLHDDVTKVIAAKLAEKGKS